MKKIILWIFVFIFYQWLFLLTLNAAETNTETPLSTPDVTISLDLQDASLKDILKVFSIQSGLNFIASESLQDRKVTLYLDKVPLKKAMEQLFKANNLSYELDREANIIIVKDWGKPQVETMTRVYPLKYGSVAGSTLKKEAERGSGGIGGIAAASTSIGDLMNVIKDVLSPNGKINEDKRTNSIIVTDIPSRFPIIDDLIARLDVPQPQVLLEVEILDVNKNATDMLGIKWASGLVKLDITGARATAFPFGGKFKDSAGSTATLAPTKTAGGWENVSWPANNFGPTIMTIIGKELAFDFLRTQADTKYLARPRILTLNNETAEVNLTKDEIVSLKQTTTTGTGGTTNTYEVMRASELKFTSEGVGISLRVTPQINLETNEITMVVNPKSSTTSASAFTINNQNQSDPEVRSTKSIVKVKDGETIVMSGLIYKDKQQTITKVPILGDIPVLGALFRHKNVSKNTDREILVFITPHIIRDTDIALAQAKKVNLPIREQNTTTGFDRKAIVSTVLNTFEKPK